MSYFIGYDIGSSSIKAAVVEAASGKTIKVVQYPDTEMEIISQRAGWAEQQPEVWWENVCFATKKLLQESGINPIDIKSIGLSYQMHGLVLVDKDQNVLRPSIIWCDSRAVDIGDQALRDLGKGECYSHLLNSPGNFTASKLKWVQDNEPEIYDQTHTFMLPGDFINMKLTGEVNATIPGLSEQVLWDFKRNEVAQNLLAYYKIDKNKIPEIVDTFSEHGRLTTGSADQLGLNVGTPVTYRAGDQPNNALSLNVKDPGEVAATGGTSGVVYAVVDQPIYDLQSRVNGFANVNHSYEKPRIGILLCINGAGIQYSWMKQHMSTEGTTYGDMEKMISGIPVGSDGLRIFPFGNGAERMFGNKNLGAQIMNLQFSRHGGSHFYRAALEGIAFSFVYGMEILQELGINSEILRVGNDNLFKSEVFSTTISELLNCKIEVMETTGAAGAAKASGVATGHFGSLDEAMGGNEMAKSYESLHSEKYEKAYDLWKSDLNDLLAKS